MRYVVMRLAVILFVTTLASSAYAHHSHPYFYDECKPMTIEGRVDRVEFKDPHTWIFLRLDDGTTYTVDWAGVSQLTMTRTIVPAKEALASGARVVVTGYRIRTAAEIRSHFPDFTSDVNPNTVDPRSIRRADDSFNWAPRTTPANCERK